MTKNTYTALIERHDDWYVGCIEELPGVNTQARTLRELRRNLRDALRLIIQANRELAGKGRGRDAKRESISIRA